jgi:hypothetical protein
MRAWAKLAILTGGVLVAAQAAAEELSGNDLRDIRIGIAVASLPSTGYADFSCTADGDVKLSGWSGWRDCPVGPDGLRGLRFGFDPATSRNGTVVAGHPAILTALVDDAGTVAGLKIETDPKARSYLRKKAFLFGPQVQARYGADGWSCTQPAPQAGEESVGSVYLKERCTKTVEGRALVIERNLFRRAGGDDTGVVDETRVTILRAHAQGRVGSN